MTCYDVLTGWQVPVAVHPRRHQRGQVCGADVTLYGGVRGIMYKIGHHGQRAVQVHGLHSTHQDQIWRWICSAGKGHLFNYL